MNSKYRLLASNTTVFAIGNILVKLISFFLMPLYTTVLTTEQYGVAELLNNTIEIVLPLATLCIVEALYRFSIDDNADHGELFINSLVVIIIGDILVGIGSIIWYLCSKKIYTLHFFLLFVSTTFYKLTCQFARGLGHVRRYAAYGVINSLVLVTANIFLLVIFKGGIGAYLLSFSIGYGLSGVLALILSKEYRFFAFNKFKLKTLKEMLMYSLPSIPNMLSWWVNSLSDRYIVLLFWGSGVTGLYTAASKLPAIINLVTSIFQQAWQYSTATEIDSKDNKVFFSNIFRIYSYICVLVCVFLVSINKLICRILLQTDFYSSWKFVPLLLLAATFGCIATYFGTFYNAIKNNKMLMMSTLIGAVGNIILNLMLIPILGAMGAAVATAISYFVIMIVRMLDVTRFIDIDINYRRFVFQISLLIISVALGCFGGRQSIIAPVICFISVLGSDFQLLKSSTTYLIHILNASLRNHHN